MTASAGVDGCRRFAFVLVSKMFALVVDATEVGAGLALDACNAGRVVAVAHRLLVREDALRVVLRGQVPGLEAVTEDERVRVPGASARPLLVPTRTSTPQRRTCEDLQSSTTRGPREKELRQCIQSTNSCPPVLLAEVHIHSRSGFATRA